MIPDLPTYLFALSWAGFFSFVLAFILPLVAALLVKASWPGPVKGITLLVLAAAKTVIEAFIQSDHFNAGAVFYAVGLNFAIGVIAYFGLLKGSQVHAALLSSGNKDVVPPPA